MQYTNSVGNAIPKKMDSFYLLDSE